MSLLETLADLPAEERAAAIDRYLALLDKPTLGAFEPWLSLRRDALRAELDRDSSDLAAARVWRPAA